MAKYWLDTSVFLTAALGTLAFDLNPEFWDQLEADAKAKLVAAPMYVHRELTDLSGREDPVAVWAVRLKKEGTLFVEPDEGTLTAFTAIADFVHTKCDQAEGDKFLSGADPWVIAHAMAGSTIVVSEERMLSLTSKRVKIPNICSNFSVGYIKTNQYLREIKEERG
jgi:Domain of unknown function (DUF4411)